MKAASMLASLLPGLRDVRAPLAAGFIWIAALWFLLEPRWPEGGTGVVGSANRLLQNQGVVGQGIIVSFAAYVLGSLSVFLFSRPLHDRLRTSLDAHGRLSGLSPLGRTSLEQVAKDGRQRIEEKLTLTGVDLAKVLADTAPAEEPERWRPPRWWSRMWQWGRRGMARLWRRVMARRYPWRRYGKGGPGVPPTPELAHEAEIQRRVIKDLPAVATAQLLGKETEVFSAVDRSEAEVDFRIALVPALVGLAVAVAVASLPDRPWLAATSGVVGALAAAGLMLDAARQRREANDLILSLMEHGRIDPPAIKRAESAALELADQAPAKVLVRQLEATRRAVRYYMSAVAKVGNSDVFRGIAYAREMRLAAQEQCSTLDALLDEHDPGAQADDTAARVLVPLDSALATIEEHFERLTTADWTEATEATNRTLAVTQRGANDAMDRLVRRVGAVVARSGSTAVPNEGGGT